FVLALPGVKRRAEFDDRDIRFLRAAELAVRLEQRLQQVFAAAGLGQRILLAQILYRRRVPKEIGKRVGVRGARWRVRIILHKVEVSIDQVRGQPRRGLRSLIAWINGGEHLLGRQQLEARKERGSREHDLLHPVDGADQRLAGLDQRIVLPARDKIRTQEGTNQASA